MSDVNWYLYRSVDTLYFRDALPMMQGENHTAGLIFPPMPQTVVGALRTFLFQQNGFDDAKLNETIGAKGEKAKFELIGPFFEKNGDYFVPLPYLCFEKKENGKKDEKCENKVESNWKKIRVAESLDNFGEDIKRQIFSPHRDKLFWVKNAENLKSVGGKYWINFKDWSKIKFGTTVELEVYQTTDFYTMESRTGIARSVNRTVREGHLYTFTHVRLNEGVRICFGINKDIGLPDVFPLKLGAEQRFGRAESVQIKENILISLQDKEGYKMLLGASVYDENMSIVATGKLKSIGGWDMYKKFHKSMRRFLPAGSIVSNKTFNTIDIPSF